MRICTYVHPRMAWSRVTTMLEGKVLFLRHVFKMTVFQYDNVFEKE